MIRRLILATLVAVALAVPVSAQWGGGWCPTCYVAASVDTVSASSLAGWAVECANGVLPHRIDVYYTDPSAPNGLARLADAQFLQGGIRPDVQAYYALYGPCVNTPLDAGWAIGLPTPIPSGYRRVDVVFWYYNVPTAYSQWVTIP